MSHIISNPHVERDLTTKFLCVLYFEDRNSLDIRNYGMDPFVIWNKIGYKAFHENVIPVILDKLIFNNLAQGYMEFIKETKRVKMTSKGRQAGSSDCI